MFYSRSILLCCGMLIASQASAKGIDVIADTITRNKNGAIVAEGSVIIKRQDEVLKADQVIYRAEQQQIQANGNIEIASEGSTIRAESARMHTVDKTGELIHAEATLKDGERLKAEQINRIDDHTMTAKDVTFTSCPPDAEAWAMKANSAELDQKEGTLTARDATFEITGIPVLYTPYWQQVLRRKSGFLIPQFSTSSIRGTEWALPYYLAPADNWDATITPHWMTARGFMGEVELRHVSTAGHETIQLEGLRDKVTSKQRGRMKADILNSLPYNIYFGAEADHVSDNNYLADFNKGTNNIFSNYLQSSASLSQTLERGDWNLLVRHQQDLRTASNAATLQILPRAESRLQLPLFNSGAIFHFDQQSTRFSRRQGVDGVRVDLNPYLEIPWQMKGGGIRSTLQVGGRHTHYWLKDVVGQNNLHRNTFEASLDNRISFERISDNRSWRHTITPILRYDHITAPDQATLPNFDSAFGRLSLSNLLTGNRFSGRDRIERLSRISALLETQLQHKGDEAEAAHTYLETRIGVAYDLKRQSVDTAVLATPTRPFSNLLGNIIVRPLTGITLSATGQYDSAAKYWATTRSSLIVQRPSAYNLRVAWQQTDARYATAANTLSANAGLYVTSRWELFADIQYDRLLKLTQQASGGIHYHHPCWNLRIEGYRSNLTGSSAKADVGFRFLIGFKGLGSVGS